MPANNAYSIAHVYGVKTQAEENLLFDTRKAPIF